MRPITLNGTTFYVSQTLPSSEDATLYAALPWTQIKGVRAIGDMVDAYQMLENRAIGKRPVKLRSGSELSAITIEQYRMTDAGQTILAGAMADYRSYAYKVVRPDDSVIYFTALASSKSQALSDGLSDSRIVLELVSAILEA